VGPQSAGRTEPQPALASRETSASAGRTVALLPLRPQHAESQDGANRQPDAALALSPRSRCNLQHRPDDARSAFQLAPGWAPLAERSSRRHTRSPGEAGGGRSDLCHDNDEPDPVNRRGRVGDNLTDLTAELVAGGSGPLEFVIVGLPARDEKLPADPQEREPELGDNREWAERSRGRDVEGLPSRALPIVLEACVHHGDIGEPQRSSGGLDPFQTASLCVHHREGRCSVGDGERKARQPGT
jgi:hypothetical protein